jgi:hypothetical protein
MMSWRNCCQHMAQRIYLSSYNSLFEYVAIRTQLSFLRSVNAPSPPNRASNLRSVALDIQLVDDNVSNLGNPQASLSPSDTPPLTMLWGTVSQPLP